MTEVVGEEDIAKDVLDAARSSMGQDISPIDLINIETFAKRVISMAEYRARLQVRALLIHHDQYTLDAYLAAACQISCVRARPQVHSLLIGEWARSRYSCLLHVYAL